MKYLGLEGRLGVQHCLLYKYEVLALSMCVLLSVLTRAEPHRNPELARQPPELKQ